MTNKDKVMAYMRSARDRVTAREVSQHIGMSYDIAKVTLHDLMVDGEVLGTGTGELLYSLPARFRQWGYK